MSNSNNKAKKKPLNKRSKFTIFAMINIVWYTIVVLIASFNDHSVPSELTYAWFSAWTIELALLFGIKVKTLKRDRTGACSINSELNSEESFYGDEQGPNDISDDYDEGLG